MKRLQLLPIGTVDAELLEWLGQALHDKFRVPAEILLPALDPAFALHAERQQYHSSVFGEAQMGGASAIVSYHRLQQQFYGLPQDMDLLANRLLIESVHELGHTLRLTHCHDYQCAMAAAHAVEWIDIKDSGFCEDCLARAMEAV